MHTWSAADSRAGFVAGALSSLIALVATTTGACFESGPLEIATGLGERPDLPADSGADTADATRDASPDPETVADTGPPVEATAPGDTLPPGDAHTDPAPDASDASDAADSLAVSDTRDDGAGPVRACLVEADCAGIEAADLCAGPIRCIDYGCRPDPALAVTCPADDVCSRWGCDPASGQCIEDNLCACDTPHTLVCGIARSWTVGQPGSREGLAAYACGPSEASATMRLFDLDVSGRVRVSASGDVRGLHVLGGDVCDGVASCVEGAFAILYFDALAGERYALAVDEGAGNQLVSVRADCDLTREESCRDGLDDDGDGLSDCEDRDCDGIAGCVLPPESERGLCGDGVDNDLDQMTDCDDSDCADDPSCLETCELLTGSIYCNYSQGLQNGSGRARATHYACNPVPQTAREMVFPITAGYTGPLRIGFQSGSGLALHLLAERGRGCTPRDCIRMSTGDLVFDVVEGETYYLAVDGPDSLIGSFYIEIDCEP